MLAPLDGVRILDLTQVLAGPFATRQLADMGAEVIKIEQAGVGDASRRFGPHFLNGESVYYLGFNRNKLGITLDLRNGEGREVFYDLVRVSDVVFDNYRPSALPRLGLDFETLKQFNPTIISCSLSGFGQEGPYKNRPAYDGMIQAMGGGMSITGEPGRPPVLMGFPMGDLGGGYVAALGIVTALFARRCTGEAQRLDLSLLDVQIALQAHLGQFTLVSGEPPGPIGSSHPSNIPIGSYQTRGGNYLQISCPTQQFYENLARVMASHIEGLEGLPEDPRFAAPTDRIAHKRELEELLQEAFLTKTREEWLRIMLEGDVPAGPVNNLAEALSDPQILLRDMVVELDHPVAGKYKSAGNPIKMGQEQPLRPAPTLGQHIDEVLQGLLAYSKDEVSSLWDAGAL